jgi:hypothetical protein
MKRWLSGLLLSTAGIGYLLYAGWVPAGSDAADLAWLGLALLATSTIGLFEAFQ